MSATIIIITENSTKVLEGTMEENRIADIRTFGGMISK